MQEIRSVRSLDGLCLQICCKIAASFAHFKQILLDAVVILAHLVTMRGAEETPRTQNPKGGGASGLLHMEPQTKQHAYL
jgi:hypothetical protein